MVMQGFMTKFQKKSLALLFENMFFKTRYIFSMTADSPALIDIPCAVPDISFEKIGKHNFLDLKTIYPPEYSPEFFQTMEKRLDNPEIWQGWLVRSGKIPVGSFWWLIPVGKKERYDSFWVDTTSILYCSGIVHPLYRGKRIFNRMHLFSFALLKKDFPTRRLLGIVEMRNFRSKQSLLRSNVRIIGKNYLIKIVGRNVISVFKPDGGIPIIWLIT
jgi:hypothetical protein